MKRTTSQRKIVIKEFVIRTNKCKKDFTHVEIIVKEIFMKKNNMIPLSLIVVLLSISLAWSEVTAVPKIPNETSTILYVKPNANGNCTTWEDACELQTALYNAVIGDEIWVAAGIYKPTTTSDRTKTFHLESGVGIYGGFPSEGGSWAERDWEINVTTLTGDIGVPDIIEDNSYHVVTGSGVDSSAILEGFTITQGNATNSSGGGMLVNSGSPSLTNVIFLRNHAADGGGMSSKYYCHTILHNVYFIENIASGYGGGLNAVNTNPGDNSLTLNNVTFSNNTALRGGGMFNRDSFITMSNVTFNSNAAGQGGGYTDYGGHNMLTDVVFNGNSSGTVGGGIYDFGKGGGFYSSGTESNILNQVVFMGNSAIGDGGGMYIESSGFTSLTNVTFTSNSAASGGGMGSSPSAAILTNVTFENNSATNGGGMYNANNFGQSFFPTLTNVTFSANTASNYGGGMYNLHNCSLTNVTFSTNSSYKGGGIYNTGSNPTLNNLTLSSNSASLSGGGIYNNSGNPTVTNSIVWGNSPNQIFGAPTVTYSIVEGGFIGDGNINADPLLNPLSSNGGFVQTQAVTDGSPAIDEGDLAHCPEFDARSFARPTDGDEDGIVGCDMGAYEISSYTPNFPLNLGVEGNGVITKEPDKPEYFIGEVVKLTAIPDVDWLFYSWDGDAYGEINPLYITVLGTTNITANFQIDAWTISASIAPIGSGIVSISPDQPTYHYGDIVTITAIPNPGWSFASWTGDISGTSSEVVVTVTDNLDITANFTLNEYTLDVLTNPTGIGSVIKLPNKPYYNYGDVVILTAETTTEGWHFFVWSGDVSGTDNPLSVTIIGNTNITANFSNQYTIDTIVNPADSGMITRDINQDTYSYGSQVILTAIPIPGWSFSGWSGDAMGFDNPFILNVIENTSIIADFTQDEYTLAVNVSPFGAGSVLLDPNQTTYHYGSQVTLTPEANLGWFFKSWSGDTEGTDSPLTITISGDTNVIANFDELFYIYLPTVLRN